MHNLQQIWPVKILLLKVQKVLLWSSLSLIVLCFLLVHKSFHMDFLNVKTEQTSPLKTTHFPCRMFLLLPQYFQDFITMENLEVCYLGFCMLSFPLSSFFSITSLIFSAFSKQASLLPTHPIINIAISIWVIDKCVHESLSMPSEWPALGTHITSFSKVNRQ